MRGGGGGGWPAGEIGVRERFGLWVVVGDDAVVVSGERCGGEE